MRQKSVICDRICICKRNGGTKLVIISALFGQGVRTFVSLNVYVSRNPLQWAGFPPAMQTFNLESDDSRQQRLDDRIRHAASRNLDSDDSREQPLEDNRIRHTVSGSLESDDSRDQRLEHDRIRHAVSLANPRIIWFSRAQRLESDHCHHPKNNVKVPFVSQKRTLIEKGVWLLPGKRQAWCGILKVKKTSDND
ncbi:hypothetical protein TNCV_642351 [Trichonephila clavipes]|nr:hypothetical protein TNCV_642351 [Trichonephila clavipes]